MTSTHRARTMKKKKDKKTIGERINGKIPLLMFLCMLANVGVIYRFESTRKPRVVYSVERVLIPSNSVPSSVSAPSRRSSVSPRDYITNTPPFSVSSPVPSAPALPVVACLTPYHYFTMGNQMCVKMWGRYYSRGSLCSYGIIRRIFPDRILLDDGSWIVNAEYDGVRASSFTTNRVKRI